MKKKVNKAQRQQVRRQERKRYKLKHVNPDSLRLSVFRSNLHIYAQIIDDSVGNTLVSASTLDKGFDSTLKGLDAARKVGEVLATRAKEKNLSKVYFDTGRYKYHGKVKALAEGARTGLSF